MVTVYDIAERAGVHASTVSRALGGKDGVRPDTRARVLKAAAELNYHPGTLMRALESTGGAVGVFMRQLYHPRAVGQFYTSVLQGIKQELAKNGLSLVLEDIPPDSENSAIAKCTTDKGFAGAILVGGITREQLEPLQIGNLPVVVVDHHISGLNLDFIVQDDLEGTRLATRLLLDKGHKRIGFAYAYNGASSTLGRLAGYRLAMCESLGCVDNSLIWEIDELNIECGRALARDMLAAPEMPTAVVAANDELAIGVMAEFVDAGKHIPGDVAVIGFDDIAWSAHTNPPLTTIRIDKESMGRLAVQRLISRISLREHIPSTSVVPTEIVVRASSG